MNDGVRRTPFGPIPAHWQLADVGAVGHVQLGRARSPATDNGPNMVPYLRVANVLDGCIDYSDVYRMHFSAADQRKYTVQKGDILLNEGQSTELVGRSALYDGPDNHYCFQNSLVNFRSGPSVDARFARLVFKRWLDIGHFITIVKQTTSMAHLGAARFANLEFPVPPPAEQRQIAAVLDNVDDAIRETEQIIAKLKQVKRGLLHDLLTRGIDGNGELRDPERHPEQFKDSMLGRVPKDWEIGSLTDVGSTERQAILTGPFGAQLGSDDFVDTGTPVLRIGNVQWGRLDLRDLQHVSCDKAASLSRFRVREGDLLFARQGATTGRNALADARVDGYLINYHIIRVAFDRQRCNPTFIHAAFNSPIVQRQVDREKGRSTREGVSTGTLTSFVLPLPPAVEQDHLAVALERHDERTTREEVYRDKLRLLKQGLMEDLLTGRVRVTKLLEADDR